MYFSKRLSFSGFHEIYEFTEPDSTAVKALPHSLQVGRLLDRRQRCTELVCWTKMTKSSVGQLPDEALAVSHRALTVVLVQLAHHDTQAVDEAFRGNLKITSESSNTVVLRERIAVTEVLGSSVVILEMF